LLLRKSSAGNFGERYKAQVLYLFRAAAACALIVLAPVGPVEASSGAVRGIVGRKVQAWSKYLRRFGGRTPVAALEKTAVRVSGAYARLLAGSGAAATNPQVDQRSAAIANHMVSLALLLEPGELAILFTGAAHSIDYHMNAPAGARTRTAFVAPPIRRSTRYAPWRRYALEALAEERGKPQDAAVAQLLEQLQVHLTADFEGRDQRGMIYRISSLRSEFAARLERSLQNIGAAERFHWALETLRPTTRTPAVIALMDVHEVDETAHVDQLPTSALLWRADIRRIVVGMESFTHDARFDKNDLWRYGGESASRDEIMRGLEQVGLHDLAETFRGPAPTHSTVTALANKLSEYEREGIKVIYRGLE
jgi:hypothetical protein